MPFEVDMEFVTLRASDRVVRQVAIVRGTNLHLLQERRDDGDQVMAYVDTGARDAAGRRVFDESVPASWMSRT